MALNRQSRHSLKTWPDLFQAVLDGKKTSEYRLNDRDFQEGDILVLCEYDPETERYSGKEIVVGVTYVMHLKDYPTFSSHSGHVVMSTYMKAQNVTQPYYLNPAREVE